MARSAAVFHQNCCLCQKYKKKRKRFGGNFRTIYLEILDFQEKFDIMNLRMSVCLKEGCAMNRPQSAVIFMEALTDAPVPSRPLMLEAVLSCPILSWMSSQLLADGVQRFFVVCEPCFAEDVRRCFPADANVTVSDLQSELNAFLNTPDSVIVLNRSAIPVAEAGPGFVYAAPGYELQDAWKEKMTNAVQGAQLLSGWLPLYGPETIAELEPALRAKGAEPPAWEK